jgi:hypothetical protein
VLRSRLYEFLVCAWAKFAQLFSWCECSLVSDLFPGSSITPNKNTGWMTYQGVFRGFLNRGSLSPLLTTSQRNLSAWVGEGGGISALPFRVLVELVTDLNWKSFILQLRRRISVVFSVRRDLSPKHNTSSPTWRKMVSDILSLFTNVPVYDLSIGTSVNRLRISETIKVPFFFYVSDELLWMLRNGNVYCY